MSKEPSSGPKEWTPERVASYLSVIHPPLPQHVARLARDINVALSAEREKSRILGNMTDGFRNQIKEHQAEYDRLSKIMEKDSFTIVELNAALAAEREKQP